MSDDLIRRSDAIEMLQEAIKAYPPVMKGCGETRDSTLEEAINLILDIPSADRPQGKWIDMGDFEQCSVCKGTRLKEFQSYYGKTTWIKTPYCPNCGTMMFAKDINVPNKEGADDE